MAIIEIRIIFVEAAAQILMKIIEARIFQKFEVCNDLLVLIFLIAINLFILDSDNPNSSS